MQENKEKEKMEINVPNVGKHNEAYTHLMAWLHTF